MNRGQSLQTGPVGSRLFGKQHRLTSSAQFQRVRREGASSRTGLVIVYTRPNEVGCARCGFVVGGRLGSAVVRNRVRRRLREILRLRLNMLPAGRDIVVVARQRAATAYYQQLVETMRQALAQVGLMPREGSIDDHN